MGKKEPHQHMFWRRDAGDSHKYISVILKVYRLTFNGLDNCGRIEHWDEVKLGDGVIGQGSDGVGSGLGKEYVGGISVLWLCMCKAEQRDGV